MSCRSMTIASMPVEHRGGRPPRLAVERMDRQPGLLVRRRRHVRVEDAADAVLRAEQRDERDVLAPRASRSIVAAPSRARPVWFVTRPTRLPRQRREAVGAQHVDARSAPADAGADRRGGVPVRRNRAPVIRRPRGRSAGTSVSADAAIVATRARSGVTSPLPSGCTRFDRKTTNMPRRRIEPQRRAGEAGVAERSDRQQLAAIGRERRIDVPAERRARCARSAGVAGVVILATVSGDSTRVAAIARRRRAASGRRSRDPPPC